MPSRVRLDQGYPHHNSVFKYYGYHFTVKEDDKWFYVVANYYYKEESIIIGFVGKDGAIHPATISLSPTGNAEHRADYGGKIFIVDYIEIVNIIRRDLVERGYLNE